MADHNFDPVDDIAAGALAELERGAEADNEGRLRVLEELYRDLEAQLDASGSEALR